MRHLGRGISFGNALDVPEGGERALRIEGRYFDAVRDAGFDTVRLPVKWSAHAAGSPPYRIPAGCFARVDRVVEGALDRGLDVVLNVHHYDELCADPDRHEARFLALWRQIAPHYAGHDDRLHFELLNEPHGRMTAERWNDLLADALTTVREADPRRTVIVGPVRRNDPDALPELVLPADDHLAVTIHYYAPFEFTHQGAGWIDGAGHWVGTTWSDGTGRDAVRRDLARAAAWADGHGRPLFVGEFGAYSRADPASRAAWTACVRSEAERLGLSWAYWEFGTDFGAFDPEANDWRPALRRALLPV